MGYRFVGLSRARMLDNLFPSSNERWKKIENCVRDPSVHRRKDVDRARVEGANEH